MSTKQIICRHSPDHGDWVIETPGVFRIAGLCADEFLGAVARILLKCGVAANIYEHADPSDPIEFRINRVDSVFVVEKNGEFTDQLDFGEVLYFLAAYALKAPLPWGGFQSYEQHARELHSWLRDRSVGRIGVAR